MSDANTLAPRNGSGAMFDAIAGRYDLLNRIISLGVDQRWRRATVRALELKPGGRVLDLATGTADLAILTAKMHGDVTVVGLDPSRNMLSVGREKLDARRLSSRITLVEGDAEKLPFGDREFDGITMAFGIRNVPDRARALREMARVTKVGGRVAILELADPKKGVLSSFARFHIHTVVPWLGSVLSGAKEYRYLHESIAAFPPAERFAEIMRESGLDIVGVHPFTFGVVTLYVATPRA